MRLLGIESLLNEQGTELNLQALLIFSAVVGFAGSFISLAISKWAAKRLTGARVIATPGNAKESWLVNTVKRQAEVAGIGMPEVAIYDAPDVNAFATGANRNKALVAVSTGLLNQLGQQEVEAVLDSHPGIRGSRVFARQHAQLGEIPAAEFVVPARLAYDMSEKLILPLERWIS